MGAGEPTQPSRTRLDVHQAHRVQPLGIVAEVAGCPSGNEIRKIRRSYFVVS